MPLLNIGGWASVFGGSIPAFIWHDYLLGALDGVPVQQFAQSAAEAGTGKRTPTGQPRSAQ